MTIIAIGLNHRSAPLEVLEGVTFSADSVAKLLSEIHSSDFINEVVVLSTCNRTEVFVHAERFHDAYSDVRDALSVVSGTPSEDFVEHLYVHFHEEAIRHLFTVTAGLDSAILGEHEILGQVRTAFDLAKDEGTARTLLTPLFDHALSCGRRARTDTAIGRRTVSLSASAVELMTERLGSLDGLTVLLVGAGELGAGVLTALGKSAKISVLVSNRTRSRAEELAHGLGGMVVDFDDLDAGLAAADVVVSATGAPGVVVTHDQVAAAREGQNELLMLDLAVPRDIDAGVLGLGYVDLLRLEDLQAFANRGIQERQREAVAAQRIVEAEISRYRSALTEREMAPLLGSLHRWSEGIRQGEVEHYAKRLAGLDDEERQAVEALTKAIMKKLLHSPSARLRETAGSTRGDRLAEAVRELFDL